MATALFELTDGVFYDKNVNFKGEERHHPDRFIRYKKGDRIESERDLVSIFVNKFRKVTNEGPTVATPANPVRKLEVQKMIEGGWEENGRAFLEGLSDDDFARIQRMTPTKPTANHETRKKSSPLGEDVTDQFQRAYDEGYTVFRNALGKHQVVKGGNKPLNPAPLDANKVESFIELHLKEK